jgi:ATP-dependent RNA helicase DDX5/DBP2
VAARSDKEIRRSLDEARISVRGSNIPRPISTFEESMFPKYIMETLNSTDFVKPTPIQS